MHERHSGNLSHLEHSGLHAEQAFVAERLRNDSLKNLSLHVQPDIDGIAFMALHIKQNEYVMHVKQSG
jgi:hypothetical protein